MPLLNGLDAAREIKMSAPDITLLFLTMHASPTYATEAWKAEGTGYLFEQSAATELPQAIETVLKGQTYLTPAITRPILESAINPARCDLKRALIKFTIAEGLAGAESGLP